jgi:phage shock protein PspC (stress-responsive transcriptional regulator)
MNERSESMEELVRKLTSRKLWLALAGIFTGIALTFGVDGSEVTTVAGAVTALASVVTYILTEGAVDMRSIEEQTALLYAGDHDDGGETD